jgi:uncharacterized membrane protein YqiK
MRRGLALYPRGVTPEISIAIAIGACLVMMVVVLLLVKGWYRSVPPGRALVISRGRDPVVSFTGALVLPIVQRADEIDLSVQRISISRRGREGVVCADNVRVDVTATFFLRVNKTSEDVLRVAQTVGCQRATDRQALDDLFAAKFSEAIKIVGKQLEFEQLFARRDAFRDTVIEVIGKDLAGYVLDDVAIDHIEQTPIECLDPDNILDAQGIRKIRERTARVDGGAPSPGEPALLDELREHGVADVRIAAEVSCDISPERAPLTLELTGVASDLALLPASVSEGVVDAVGRCRLTCAAGRVTLRWDDTEITRPRLVAGARLVHAVRIGGRVSR